MIKTIIYLDVVIILNFVINYCFIKLIYMIFNEKTNKIRLILSSIISVLLLFSFFFDYIIFNVIKILGGIILIIISFKFTNKNRFLIMTSLYYILQFSFIGLLSIFNIKGIFIFALLLLICLLVIIITKKSVVCNNHKNIKVKIKLTKEYILLDGYLDTGNISSYNEYPIVFLDKKYYDLNLKVYSVTQIKTINGLEYINCYKPKEFFIFDNNKLISKEVLVSFSNFNNNINCLLNNLMFS